jgi:hypothetical protein
VSPRGRSSKQSSISPRPEGGIYTCLFLPYLHFDSYKRLIRRRELIIQRLGHGRARPVPESVAKSDSLESQVIWEFLGHDPPLNCRRTLDQYGYPSLRDTRSRDDDQMLYKLTKERKFAPGLGPGLHGQMSNSSSGSSGSGSRRSKTSSQDGDNEEDSEEAILNGNVLMVDQLWLWAIDSRTSYIPAVSLADLQIPYSPSSRGVRVMPLKGLCISRQIFATASLTKSTSISPGNAKMLWT